MCECHCLMKCFNVTHPQKTFLRGDSNLLHRNFPLNEESEGVLRSICYTPAFLVTHGTETHSNLIIELHSTGGGFVFYSYFGRDGTFPFGMRTVILTFCKFLQAHLCIAHGWKPSIWQKLHLRLCHVSNRTRKSGLLFFCFVFFSPLLPFM